jgi:hypothetical protein
MIDNNLQPYWNLCQLHSNREPSDCEVAYVRSASWPDSFLRCKSWRRRQSVFARFRVSGIEKVYNTARSRPSACQLSVTTLKCDFCFQTTMWGKDHQLRNAQSRRTCESGSTGNASKTLTSLQVTTRRNSVTFVFRRIYCQCQTSSRSQWTLYKWTHYGPILFVLISIDSRQRNNTIHQLLDLRGFNLHVFGITQLSY